MGISVRMRYLISRCKTDEQSESLAKSYKMLMSSDGGMGSAFKVMSIFPKTLETILAKRGGTPNGFLHSLHKNHKNN